MTDSLSKKKKFWRANLYPVLPKQNNLLLYYNGFIPGIHTVGTLCVLWSIFIVQCSESCLLFGKPLCPKTKSVWTWDRY